jgi:single-stranded DNA-binding protein
MSTQRGPHVQLAGILGADPETLTLPGRHASCHVYDPITDDVVLRETTTPSQQLRTATFITRVRNPQGHESTCRHRLIDRQDHLKTFREGDRISVWGYLQSRQYTEKGESKTVREFIVTTATLLASREKAA